MQDVPLDLIHASQAGDRQATGELVAWCEPIVRACVRKLRLALQADRDDASQVARMAVMTAIVRYDGDRFTTPFRPWAAHGVRLSLQTWMTSRCLRRERVRPLSTIAAQFLIERADPNNDLAMVDARELVTECLRRLPALQQHVLEAGLAGETDWHLSRRLGVSNETIRLTRAKAIHFLQCWLGVEVANRKSRRGSKPRRPRTRRPGCRHGSERPEMGDSLAGAY